MVLCLGRMEDKEDMRREELEKKMRLKKLKGRWHCIPSHLCISIFFMIYNLTGLMNFNSYSSVFVQTTGGKSWSILFTEITFLLNTSRSTLSRINCSTRTSIYCSTLAYFDCITAHIYCSTKVRNLKSTKVRSISRCQLQLVRNVCIYLLQ